jgi:4-amino-4-deoxy-L-arabinose transferase-like glycosyltransferase
LLRSHWLPALLLVGILLPALFLRTWQLGALALVGDESYYWLWSQNLDWAYYDHPAGVALLVWASTALGGQDEAGIRWLNAVLGVASVGLVYLLGGAMLSRRAGLFAALLLAVGGPYLVTSRLVYTDALLLFALLLNLYWFWRLVTEQPRPRLGTALAFGLSLAVLFNTKYSAYLYAVALGLAVLLDGRRLLAERRFWLGALIGALGLLPVLVWNAAHDWASLRWQFSHLAFSLNPEPSLLGSVRHSLGYLTWPLVAVALVGLIQVRRPAERLLTLVALLLLLPVALSPANSPRNLTTGLVALLLLAGARWPAALDTRRQRWAAGLLALGAVAVLAYGLGTVLDLTGPVAWPHSSVTREIRRDAAGWRELGPELAAYPAPVFTLDYSIASQIWYYSGRPAYTAWPQYRLWGLPPMDDVTVVGLEYLPTERVTERLRRAFEAVHGPQRLVHPEWGTVKVAYVWLGEGLRLQQEAFLEAFDFVRLLLGDGQ